MTEQKYPVIDFDAALNKLLSHSMAITDLPALISELGSNIPGYFHNKYEGGLRLQQVPNELSQLSASLLQRFAGTKVRYLEVGVGSCGTLIFLGHLFAKHGGVLVPSAIDDFSYTSEGRLLDQRCRVRWCEKNLGLRFLETDSSSQRSVEAWFGNNSYDLILIDADHSFEGCLVDFLTYLPHLDRNGVLLFHDVTSSSCAGVGEVYKFAESYFETHQLFSESNNCGIGLLTKWKRKEPSALDIAGLCRKHIRSLSTRGISYQDDSISVKRLVWKRLKQKIKLSLYSLSGVSK